MRRYLILLLLSIGLYGGNINVGYSSASMNNLSKKDTMIVLSIWMKALMNSTKHTVSFNFYDDIYSMSEDFKNDKLDLVVAFGLEYIEHFDREKLENGFTGGSKDREDENLILLIEREASLQNLMKAKRIKIAVQEEDEASRLYAKYLFLKNNKNTEISFVPTRKRNGALLKLFFKQTKMAIVSEKTFEFAKELNPQIGKKLKVAKYTDITSKSFGFFRKGFNKEISKEIMKIASNIEVSTYGKQILTIFKTDSIIEARVKDLESIDRLYKNYNQLKKGKK